MPEGYTIIKGRENLQIERVKRLLVQTYWAADRSEATILKSIENSICYGVYDNNSNQIGFARVITDYATTYYLCDVIIDKEHRGKGIGFALLEFITDDEELKGLRGILATRDAHEFYKKFGFCNDIERFMTIPWK